MSRTHSETKLHKNNLRQETNNAAVHDSYIDGYRYSDNNSALRATRKRTANPDKDIDILCKTICSQVSTRVGKEISKQVSKEVNKAVREQMCESKWKARRDCCSDSETDSECSCSCTSSSCNSV